MKYSYSFLFLFSFALLSYQPEKTAIENSKTKKWVSLFNGKDLKNWKPKITGHQLGENFGNTFRVADGLLQVRYDQYDRFKTRFGALYYDKKFTNYRLKVEYRFIGDTTPGAPSWGYRDGGIQYHGQNPSTIGLNQNFPVCLEWVTAEIEVKNGAITHFVNGEKILEYKNPRLDSAHALGKTLITGGNNIVKDGYISIQSNSHPIDFRTIEIMEY